MGRFHLLGLRWRLLLLVALAITPLIAMTIAVGVREREHALTSARSNLQRLANLAAANEAQSIEQARQILRDLSSVPTVLEGERECHALLADILAKNTDYVNFGVIARNGEVNCSAVDATRKVNLGDRAHFKRAVSERRFIAGNYVFGRVVQKHTVNLTYPIIKDGNVLAVMFAALNLAELDKFVDDIRLPTDSVLWTLDEAGTVISRRPHSADWLGKPAPPAQDLVASTRAQPTVRMDPDGVERLYASAPVGPSTLSNYRVLIGVPESGILADARRDQRFAVLGLLTTLVLAGLAAWWGGDLLIVRRVRRLASTANDIASGALSTRSGIRYGHEEIGDLARALDEMARSLEARQVERDDAVARLVAADQRKDEFLAMLAHELRNPLAPISAGSQILLQTQNSNPLVTRTATIIARQVAHMTGLVDDLLDVSRVTRGLVSLDSRVVDMRSIVNDAIEQVSPLLRKKRQQISVELPGKPGYILGDHKRMVQIATNLLNNAAKYTSDEGEIRVVLLLESHQVVLRVSDDGIGMDPELVPQVFDLFTQAERASDRSQGGLGIGLALVKNLVQLHGGTAKAESPGLGLGSTFTVALPRAQGPNPAATPTRIDSVHPSCRQCLVVDDNVDAAQTLALFLEVSGHQAHVAHSGAAAVAAAERCRPDVCLLDIGLPDFSGIELVRMLRRQSGAKDAIMIAVTGYGRKEDREIALSAGFDHYFVKPFDTALLSAVLTNLVPQPAETQRTSTYP